MIGVYAITNKINGMSYIGQSTNIKRRWINHRCMNGKPGNALYNDIRKYGLENFTFEVLEICEKDKLIEMELHYIQEYDSVNNGYNVTESNENPLYDPKIKEKAEERSRIAVKSSEYKAKLGERTARLWQTSEYRNKVVFSLKNSEKLHEQLERIKKDPIVLKKISKASKNRMNKPENRAAKSIEIKAAWERGSYSSVLEKLGTYTAKPCTMLDAKSGEKVIEFKSASEAATWLKENTKFKKADNSTISKAIKRGNTSYGYKWELL